MHTFSCIKSPSLRLESHWRCAAWCLTPSCLPAQTPLRRARPGLGNKGSRRGLKPGSDSLAHGAARKVSHRSEKHKWWAWIYWPKNKNKQMTVRRDMLASHWHEEYVTWILFSPFVPISSLPPGVGGWENPIRPPPGQLQQLIDFAVKIGPVSRAQGLEFIYQNSRVFLSITRIGYPTNCQYCAGYSINLLFSAFLS